MRFILSFFLLLSTLVRAQNTSFINNCLKRDTILNQQTLFPVLQQLIDLKLDRSASAVRIVQIGDSHIQMGHFSKAIRMELTNEFTLSGTGFWFPLSACKSYGPEEIQFASKGNWECDKMVNSSDGNRFGITGHAYTLAEGTGNITISNVNKSVIRKLEIIHEWNPDWVLVSDSGIVQTIQTGANTAVSTIVYQSELKEINLQFSSDRATKELRIFGFRVNNPDILTGLDFHYYGSSGAKFSDFCFNSAYVFEHMMVLKPDLLIVSLGTNDSYVAKLEEASYFEMVNRFIARIRLEFPNTTILLTSQPDTKYKSKKPINDQLVTSTLRKVAIVNNCAFWDLSEAMGGKNSMKTWLKKGLADRDQLHFNPKGFALQAKLLVYAIEQVMETQLQFKPTHPIGFTK